MNPRNGYTHKDEWLTPPEIVQALGPFDLDPCSPIARPWATAQRHYTIEDNGLLLPWTGRVWLNPPYGRELILWLEKMAEHRQGVALTFARTETSAFQRFVWPIADSMLFLAGRLHFHHVDGSRAGMNGGAPSVLIAYGEGNSDILAACGLPGKHVAVNGLIVSVVGFTRSWRLIIQSAFIRLDRAASVAEITAAVERLAPEKTSSNRFYREKIRQQLRRHFRRVSKGFYEK